MKIYFFLVLLVIVFGQRERQVDALFAPYLSIPGAAIGIFQNEKLIYSKGYGFAHLEHNIPINENTTFDIASVSKQITALCMVLASQEGYFSLDDQVNKFLPEIKHSLTIKNLIHHLGGLKDYVELHFLTGEGLYYTPERTTELIARQNKLFNAGDKFDYSNSGYFLLSVIIERAVKKTLTDFAKEQIFDKLGMSNTQFYNDQRRIVKNRAVPYRDKDGWRIEQIILDHTGDGAIITTVTDWAKYEKNWYNNILGKEPRRVIPQLLELGRLNNGRYTDYAFGLTLDEYRGLKTIEHGGSWGGYQAEFIRFPDQKFSVVLFSNNRDMKHDLTLKIADIYLRNFFTKSDSRSLRRFDRKEMKETKTHQPIMKYSNEILGFYCSDDIGVTYEIKASTNSVYFEIRNLGSVKIVMGRNDEFTTNYPFKGKFLRSSGNIVGFNLIDEDIGEIYFKRLPSKPQCY